MKQASILILFPQTDDLFLTRRIADIGAELLQAMVHQRYELRHAIVITPGRVVRNWGKHLGDATMATTIARAQWLFGVQVDALA